MIAVEVECRLQQRRCDVHPRAPSRPGELMPPSVRDSDDLDRPKHLVTRVTIASMHEPRPNKLHRAPHMRKRSANVHNVNAFGYTKGERASQAVARQLNIEHIRLSRPETRALTTEDPPLLVAVQDRPAMASRCSFAAR